jgi:hypothetical protein
VRRNLSYPKDGDRKLRETVKDLKKIAGQLRKENEMLKRELENIVKPVRQRKERTKAEQEKYLDSLEDPAKTMTQDEWRKSFIREFKPRIDRKLAECKANEDDKED